MIDIDCFANRVISLLLGHAIESIFISCRVTKTRWPLSNFELDGVEDFCQKAFKVYGMVNKKTSLNVLYEVCNQMVQCGIFETNFILITIRLFI